MSDLASLLDRRVVFTEDLRAYNFMRQNKSLMTPFTGVFVPPGMNHVYPIKGRFFLKQQADTITGYVDDKEDAQINGSITTVKKKMTFDMRIHWPNMDYTTIGVTKGKNGASDKLRLGNFDGDRMTFPFYHSTYQVGTDDGYLNSSSTRGALWRLSFSDEKETVFDKVVKTLSRFQQFYKNISLKDLGESFDLDEKKAQDLAYCAIKANVLKGSINQKEGLLVFDSDGAQDRNRAIFKSVQDLVGEIKSASS